MPPLSPEQEARLRDDTRLEATVTKARSAILSGSDDEIDATLTALNDFRFSTPFVELQQRAQSIHEKLSDELIDDALEEMNEIYTELQPAGKIFKDAVDIAESGKKELLIPRLAATAEHAWSVFITLQDAVDKVGDALDDVDELGDIPDAFAAAKNALAALKEAIDNTAA